METEAWRRPGLNPGSRRRGLACRQQGLRNSDLIFLLSLLISCRSSGSVPIVSLACAAPHSLPANSALPQSPSTCPSLGVRPRGHCSRPLSPRHQPGKPTPPVPAFTCFPVPGASFPDTQPPQLPTLNISSPLETNKTNRKPPCLGHGPPSKTGLPSAP